MTDGKIVKTLLKDLLITLDGFATLSLKSKAKRDLAIVRLDAIGDLVLWLDCAKEYRRLYPAQKIVLIANSIWADLARELPFWDEVWSVDLSSFRRNPCYRWRLLRKINQAGFELAIQPTYSRELLLGDSIIRATAATERIGSKGDLSNISVSEKTISDHWYTRVIPAVDKPLMELDRNAEFMSHLSDQEHPPGAPKLPRLTNLPEYLKLKGDYFIVFPGASWSGKQWPVTLFASCLNTLSKQYGWHAVLCGVTPEYQICQSVIDHSSVPKASNLAGKTSLMEFVEIVRGAQLLIGNDTSAVHIASAVNTPSVCILGGGHFGRFMPYTESMEGAKPAAVFFKMPCFGCNWQCSQPHEKGTCVPCISRINVQSVLDGVKRALR